MKKVTRKFKVNKNIYGIKSGGEIFLRCNETKNGDIVNILDLKWDRIFKERLIDDSMKVVNFKFKKPKNQTGKNKKKDTE